jgi:hypothetical protein
MRRSLAAITAGLALGSMVTPGAAALEEIGDPCLGSAVESGGPTMLVLNNQGSSPFMQPGVPPEHKYVITRWRVQVGPGIGPLRQQLVASSQVGEEEDVKVGESAVETLVAGNNEFSTRLAVSEYDHIGLRGPEQTLICNQEGNVAGRVAGEWPSGERRHLDLLVHVGVPVVVRVERDRDLDGFGDETQDGCPATAALQTACPTLSLTASREVKKRAILVRASTTNGSTVQAVGRVGWGVRRIGGGKRRVTVGLSAGAPRAVEAGITTTFRLPLPPPVQRRLDRLPRKQRLRANLTVSVTDVYGTSVETKLIVRLRGRG